MIRSPFSPVESWTQTSPSPEADSAYPHEEQAESDTGIHYDHEEKKEDMLLNTSKCIMNEGSNGRNERERDQATASSVVHFKHEWLPVLDNAALRRPVRAVRTQ